jgi:uncharacterized protein
METTSEIINQIIKIIKKDIERTSNKFGVSIWKHIELVRKYGKELAINRGADIEIVEISALLHDIASIRSLNMYRHHHIHGSRIANDILVKLNYPADRIRKIQDCILSHRGSIPRKGLSIESICLADADAMSHFSSIPDLYSLYLIQFNMHVSEAEEHIFRKMRNSWSKLSFAGKKQILGKYLAFLELFD